MTYKSKSLVSNSILALVPLFIAFILYFFLPSSINIPTLVSSGYTTGPKSSIFVFPIFCIVIWIANVAFILLNRLREKNYSNIGTNFTPLEKYYVWASWVIDIFFSILVIFQAVISI